MARIGELIEAIHLRILWTRYSITTASALYKALPSGKVSRFSMRQYVITVVRYYQTRRDIHSASVAREKARLGGSYLPPHGRE